MWPLTASAVEFFATAIRDRAVGAGHHQLRVHNTISRKIRRVRYHLGEQVRSSAAKVRGKGFASWRVFSAIAPM